MPVIWTPEMINRLTQLCLMQDAARYSEIAEVLSREFATEVTKNACIGCAYRVKISNGHKPGRHGTPKPPQKPKRKPPDERPGRKRATAEKAAPTLPPQQSHLLGRVPFMELRYGDCRWPFGNSPYLFCGDTVDGHGPYCRTHRVLSTTGKSLQ
jgi:hypothetical protein